MAGMMIRGQLVGVVEGPAMVLNVKGDEKKYDLGVQVSLGWISQHMDQQVTVLVDDGKITEVM